MVAAARGYSEGGIAREAPLVRSKLTHFVIGTSVALLGVIGVRIEAIGPVGRLVSIVAGALGFLWALVIGHAPFILLFVVGIHFSTARYLWRNPIRVRRGVPCFDLGPVAAFAADGSRLLVVTLSAAGTYGHAIHRRRAILDRARRTLLEGRVPEIEADDARLRGAVARWNVDPRVLEKLVGLKRVAPPEGRPWIDLDDRTRSSVDRVFHVLSVLRGCVDPSERDDVVLLALWYADACDEAYDRRNRSHWDRILVEA